MIPKDKLKNLAQEYGIELSDAQIDRFDLYAQILVEWNQKMNLTAITEPDDIVVKHFVDSLLLLKAYDVPKNASMIDVGTGAGFPSVPVAIARDDIKLTLLDSLNKRINFLTHVCNELKIPAKGIHSRAEDGAKKPPLRQSFDVATARAVAHLRELSEYCLPYVKKGGYFVALKGYEIEQELEEAKKAISLMGGKIKSVEKFVLADDNKRSIVIIEKVAPTPNQYPRNSAKIAKSPIK